MNSNTMNAAAISAAAVMAQVLALSYHGDGSAHSVPAPSEPALLFQLVTHIDADLPSHLAAAAATTTDRTTPPRRSLQHYADSLAALLFRAIELDYPALTATLLRMHPAPVDWDTLAAAAVGSQAPAALRAILSHPSFAFRAGSVLWTAWGNGDRQACEMVVRVGQVRDCQLAYVIAYEEEGVGVEPMIPVAEARRALARAMAVGQRPLAVEVEREAAVPEVGGIGRPSLLDLPDDVLEYWVCGGFVGQRELCRLRQTCQALNARLPQRPSSLTRDMYWRLLTHLMTGGPIAPQVTSLVACDLGSAQHDDGRLVLLQALATLRSINPTTAALDHVKASFTVVVAMDVLLLAIDDHFMHSDPPLPLDSSPAFNDCFATAFATIADVLIPDLIHVPAFLHAVHSLDLTGESAINTPKRIVALLIQGNYPLALRLIDRHATQLAAAKLDLIHTLAVALRLGTCPTVVKALLNDVGAWSPMVRMDCIEVSRVLVHAVAAGSVERVREVMGWFPDQFKVAGEMPSENWRKCEAAAVKYADRGGRACLKVLRSRR